MMRVQLAKSGAAPFSPRYPAGSPLRNTPVGNAAVGAAGNKRASDAVRRPAQADRSNSSMWPPAGCSKSKCNSARRFLDELRMLIRNALRPAAVSAARGTSAPMRTVAQAGLPAAAALREAMLVPLSTQVAAEVVPATLRSGGFGEFPYGSSAAAQLVPNSNPLSYVTGYVPTPLSGGQIVRLGGNNFAVPAWQQEVAAAAMRNGGLGDAATGYLAWSKLGFVRLKNEFLSDEQNQRLADLSLQLGMEVERLPSATVDSACEAAAQDEDIAQLLAEFAVQKNNFAESPGRGIELAFGRRRFGIAVSGEGVPLSYQYTKKSGWTKFGSKLLVAAGTALEWTSASAWIRIAGRTILGDAFKANPHVSNLLSQDLFYLSGDLARRYASGEIELRDAVRSYLQAGATTAQLGSVLVPATRPIATAASIGLSVAAEAAAESN